MKIITKTFILLSAALGLPFVTPDFDTSASVRETASVSSRIENGLCRMIHEGSPDSAGFCQSASRRLPAD